MKINILEPSVYNRISAGEVVDKPASIVKELVENSIDAGAKNIRISIEEGGIKNITISDDGCGIDREDLPIAFKPHTTSKIKYADDLDDIKSLGFRGEALASIASVCQVTLSTKTKDSAVGYSIKINGGEEESIKEIARLDGTTISCSNLFFNTPVRAKFLRRPKTEESDITHLVEKLMLSYSNIAFQYYVDGHQVYNTRACSMSDIIYTIYGEEIFNNLIEVDYEEGGFHLYGYITKPKVAKSNRTYQTLFVNKRYVENSLVSACLSNMYSPFLMKGRFPVFVLNLDVPSGNVDVNVHPSKREVRFESQNKIYGLVSRGIEKALLSSNQIQSFFETASENEISAQKATEENSKSEQASTATAQKFTKEQIKEYLLTNKIKLRETVSPTTGGKSYSIDLFDPKQKIDFTPIKTRKIDEVDIEAFFKPQQNEESLNSEIENLSNLSIKKEEENKNSSTIYYNMSNDKFFNEIARETPKFLEASVKDEMNIIGTVFKTYIAIEYDNALYFIDQHAAHERLLYDKLVKHIDEGNNALQPLMAPYSFKVGAKESQYIDELLPRLKEIGFEIEKNDEGYVIKAVPLLISFIDLSKFVDEILSEKMDLNEKASDFVHTKLCQSACKHAIKAGDTITKDECAYLIEEIRKGVMLCPHGRPVTLVINKHEFEKMFKRII